VDLIDFFVNLMLGGPWFWLGVALGLVGGWVAWTYLPDSTDRASIAALVLISSIVLGVALAGVGREKHK
jgi:hypothetical protein